MSSSVEGIFILLLGLGGVWVGIFGPRANRTAASGRGRQPQRRWTRTEVRLWLIAWVLEGLGLVCFGVTVLRYAQGRYVSVPASAPLGDRVIWVFAQVGIIVWFALLFWWMMLHRGQDRRSHPEDV